MNLEDHGFIIRQKKLQEKGLLIFIFSKNNGLVTGYCNKSRSPIIIGSYCHFVKKSRLSEHLGMLIYEKISSPSPQIMYDKTRLTIFNSIIELLNTFLSESLPFPSLFDELSSILETIDSDPILTLIAKYISFEFHIINQLGFGLDLNKCAVSGSIDELEYISPKTGAVVCKTIGLPYHDKLLKLPKFLREFTNEPEALLEAFGTLDFVFYKLIMPNFTFKTLSFRENIKESIKSCATI